MSKFVGHEVNEAHGVGAFLRRWHGVAPALDAAPVEPRRSETGNVNLAATIGSSPSVLLAPADARFGEFIEPEVAPLVDAVVAAGWISYTSCEGHRYPDGTADETHVGLIPRHAIERVAIADAWRAAAEAWADMSPASAIEYVAVQDTLRCDGRVDLPTIELYLRRRRDRSWDAYFAARSEAVRRAALLLAPSGPA